MIFPTAREARIMQIGHGRVECVLGDITHVAADAIVNAANSALLGGGGVDGAIHRAGGPSILAECRRIGGCPTGGAVATGAGTLRARYVIHAVAPIYHGRPEDARLLSAAYASSLDRARDLGCASVAFPSLGTGAYGYPVDEAAPLAAQTVRRHLNEVTSVELVTFVLFSERDLAAYVRAFAAYG